MSNKKRLNKVIEDDFNQNNNYLDILNRIEKKNKNINFLKYCFTPLVIVMLVFIGYNYNNKLSIIDEMSERKDYSTYSNEIESTNKRPTTDSKYGTDQTLSFNGDIHLNIVKSKKCKKYKYYSKDITIYTYCIDSIRILDNVELSEYLSNHNAKDTIENIINNLNKEAIFRDGGSILYREIKPYKVSNEGISILKCNTVSGNKDIYIGLENMKYESDFCK